jgi:hypothetical protein
VFEKWILSRTPQVSQLAGHDRPFILGHIVSTVSCFSFMSSYVFTIVLATLSDRSNWGELVSHLLSGVGALCLLGIFILPFGHTRIKWLSLLGCSLNAVLLFSFAFFTPETS